MSKISANDVIVGLNSTNDVIKSQLTGTPSGNLGVGGGFLIPVFLSDPSQTSSPMLRSIAVKKLTR